MLSAMRAFSGLIPPGLEGSQGDLVCRLMNVLAAVEPKHVLTGSCTLGGGWGGVD